MIINVGGYGVPGSKLYWDIALDRLEQARFERTMAHWKLAVNPKSAAGIRGRAKAANLIKEAMALAEDGNYGIDIIGG